MSRWSDQLIDAMPTPGDAAADQRAAAIVRVKHRLDDIADWFAQLADLDRATATGSAGVKVTASKEPPSPIRMDLLDLQRRLRPADPRAVPAPEWAEDQVGHLAVASELLFWVRDWAGERAETVPLPNVWQLTRWLGQGVRLEWAYDHHGAWDEMAASMERVSRALYATVTPKRARATPVSAPCPDGDCPGPLRRHEDGWVECSADGCTHALSERDYRDWSKLVIARIAHNGWGICAKELSIRYGVPMGTVHRLAHQHAWPRTGKEHRPVMYDKQRATATFVLLAEREAEMANAA